MLKPERVPIALTIAGSDSGGGAGIQADLKTFLTLGVHGTSVITCLTAQNPRRVIGIQAAHREMVSQQLTAVFSELRPQAAKTGMLFSTEIIRAVATFLGGLRPRVPLVVDPVLIATSGATLLRPSAIQALKRELLPLAELVTPNVPEAEALLGMRIREPEDLRTAARKLRQAHGCAALVKGGHLTNYREALDVFYDGKTELLLSAPRIRGVSLHGTGCTYSAAIAAHRARGCTLVESVTLAKDYVTDAIAQSVRAGRHTVLRAGEMPGSKRK